jgi:hypothetical protein
MVLIPYVSEANMRPPKREHERLVSGRIGRENRIGNLLCLLGVIGFKPRLKKAMAHLEAPRHFLRPRPLGTRFHFSGPRSH